MDVEALRRGEVHAWIIDALRAEASDLALLDASEREAAARFRQPEDAARFVARRAARRRILATYADLDAAALRFETTCTRCGKPHGKPRLHAATGGDVRFNASHADGTALLVVARAREVGADIESPRRAVDVDAVAARFLSEAEQATLQQEEPVAAFLRAWSAKEAYLKLRGLGLAAPLERVDTAHWAEGAWTEDPLEAGSFALLRPAVSGQFAAAVAVDRLRPHEAVPVLRVARWGDADDAPSHP